MTSGHSGIPAALLLGCITLHEQQGMVKRWQMLVVEGFSYCVAD